MTPHYTPTDIRFRAAGLWNADCPGAVLRQPPLPVGARAGVENVALNRANALAASEPVPPAVLRMPEKGEASDRTSNTRSGG